MLAGIELHGFVGGLQDLVVRVRSAGFGIEGQVAIGVDNLSLLVPGVLDYRAVPDDRNLLAALPFGLGRRLRDNRQTWGIGGLLTPPPFWCPGGVQWDSMDATIREKGRGAQQTARATTEPRRVTPTKRPRVGGLTTVGMGLASRLREPDGARRRITVNSPE